MKNNRDESAPSEYFLKMHPFLLPRSGQRGGFFFLGGGRGVGGGADGIFYYSL